MCHWGKRFRVVLNVLIEHEGNSHTARTLVNTGTKETFIMQTGIFTRTVIATHTLNLITADRSPMKRENVGAFVHLKIPLLVPSKKKMEPFSIVCKRPWV